MATWGSEELYVNHLDDQECVSFREHDWNTKIITILRPDGEYKLDLSGEHPALIAPERQEINAQIQVVDGETYRVKWEYVIDPELEEKFTKLGEKIRKFVDKMPHRAHVDPMQFRGHLKNCHAWRWENYSRCSCHIHFTPCETDLCDEAVNPIDAPMKLTVDLDYD